MAFDFPSSPVNGQVYEGFVYDASTGSWRGANATTPLSTRISAIELLVPAGTIHQYAGGQAPAGYLFCQGQAISRSIYGSLFSVIGTQYGAGDGSTTFNLPDLQGRVPVGKSASGTFATLNNKGGAETHTLLTSEMPVHTHNQNSHTHTGTTSNPGDHRHLYFMDDGASSNGGAERYNYVAYDATSSGAGNGGFFWTNYAGGHTHTFTTAAATAVNQNTGGGLAHNNLQPYNTVNYIIKF